MGAFVFDNEIFDQWLNHKSQEILSKVNRETITNEEMLILILKAQTNHFYHMDHDIKEEISLLRNDMNTRFEQVEKRFEQVDKRFEQVDKRFEQVDKRFEQVDKRFEQIYTLLMWAGGIILAANAASAMKAFF